MAKSVPKNSKLNKVSLEEKREFKPDPKWLKVCILYFVENYSLRHAYREVFGKDNSNSIYQRFHKSRTVIQFREQWLKELNSDISIVNRKIGWLDALLVKGQPQEDIDKLLNQLWKGVELKARLMGQPLDIKEIRGNENYPLTGDFIVRFKRDE